VYKIAASDAQLADYILLHAYIHVHKLCGSICQAQTKTLYT